MIDLGFKGNKYTWSNKRYKNRCSLILERLDRCLANNSWILNYPEASVTHLSHTRSDHCLLLISLGNRRPNSSSRTFRLQPSQPNSMLSPLTSSNLRLENGI
ncbi:hypothetical protein H5410_012893 [Solanum commersonii]|uniref:Endonuclease/exonuclease/phosphatase domain-containing protein n=1 Tax=Solanum commersonii TaxID=4109 RepID=A0A9J6ATQ7_SOLCO|nr:hypothetical protein H5410_012893 [Solanum commersonii]